MACPYWHRFANCCLAHSFSFQVDLYESGTIAIVEAVSPELGNRVQRVRVQLPGTSQELLTKFREKKVDFAAHTATEDGGAVFLNLLGMRHKNLNLSSSPAAPFPYYMFQQHVFLSRSFSL